MKKTPYVIPRGPYCYTVGENGKRIDCPYWSIRKDRPEQMNGYCYFLEKGDWELKRDGQWYHADGTPMFEYEIKDLPKEYGLIWDQVKECGINMDND